MDDGSLNSSLVTRTSSRIPYRPSSIVHRPLWYWALIPMLAIVAYASVLRIGFLSDDFVLLYDGKTHGVDWLPAPGAIFYRPVGSLIIWVLGWDLWGYNPLPFHVISLLLHAASSLLLGLWLAEATSRPALGWLAGAFFAVFPLHTEAVGWAAAQWDAWALFLGLVSLYCFTLWWRRGGLLLYTLAFLSYALGIFMKESMLIWLPILALSAWFIGSPQPTQNSKFKIQNSKLSLALLPFGAVLALNLGLRLYFWGRVGGYGQSRADLFNFLWDGLAAYGRTLLAPVSGEIVGDTTFQAMGAFMGVLLLVLLTLYGYRQRRLLLLAGVWVLLALLPVLSLAVEPADGQFNPSFNTSGLHNSRFAYMAAAGYCVIVAALMYEAIRAASKEWRPLAMTLIAAGLLGSMVLCWAQLRPWHTATAQVEDIATELRSLIPPEQRPKGMVWYVENVPVAYRDAPVLYIGLDRLRYFEDGDSLQFRRTPNAAETDLSNETRDAYAMRFYYDPLADRFRVNYLKSPDGIIVLAGKK